MSTAYRLQTKLFLFGRFGQFEGGLADNLSDRAAADALGANFDSLPGTIGRADMELLEIRLELPPGNTGHLRAHAA
jgi:hypothetical protein